MLTRQIGSSVIDAIAEKIATEEHRERKWQMFIKRQAPWEKKFAEKLKGLFREQEREVLGNMEKYPKQITIEDLEGKTIKNWETDWLFNKKKWEKQFSKEGKPFIGGVLEETGIAELADLAVGIDFDINNPRVQKWLGWKLEKYSKDVNGTTLKQLKKTLREGVSAGEGIPKLRKRVQEVFSGASKVRAEMIARTETITAANAGNIEAYRQSGVVKKKEWFCGMDERSCEICMGMHGEVVGLEENFSYGIAHPTAHPRCRCDTLPVME